MTNNQVVVFIFTITNTNVNSGRFKRHISGVAVVIRVWSVPGLLAVEQTKSALRGRRNSCRVMEPLEADMPAGSGAALAFFWPVGSPFRRSSSAFNASLLSAKNVKRKRKSSFDAATRSRQRQTVVLF